MGRRGKSRGADERPDTAASDSRCCRRLSQGLAVGSTRTWAAPEDGISHTADSIHQEPVFTASPKRVYEALTDAKQFDTVIQLSGVMQPMHLPAQPVEISQEAGGAFTLFGGFITGRHVERVPNVRIVQAWRTGAWPRAFIRSPGSAGGAGLRDKIEFDHTGFPRGDAKAWLRDGKRTSGSRWARSWLGQR